MPKEDLYSAEKYREALTEILTKSRERPGKLQTIVLGRIFLDKGFQIAGELGIQIDNGQAFFYLREKIDDPRVRPLNPTIDYLAERLSRDYEEGLTSLRPEDIGIAYMEETFEKRGKTD